MATLHYGTNALVVPDETVPRLREQISGAILSGQPQWLRVEGGSSEGGWNQDFDLLITPGVPIAIAAVAKPQF